VRGDGRQRHRVTQRLEVAPLEQRLELREGSREVRRGRVRGVEELQERLASERGARGRVATTIHLMILILRVVVVGVAKGLEERRRGVEVAVEDERAEEPELVASRVVSRVRSPVGKRDEKSDGVR
jgi:hypothetical protein